MKNLLTLSTLPLCCAFLVTPALATPTGTVQSQTMDCPPGGSLTVTAYCPVTNPDVASINININDKLFMYGGGSYFYIGSLNGSFTVPGEVSQTLIQGFFYSGMGQGHAYRSDILVTSNTPPGTQSQTLATGTYSKAL